MAKGDSTGIAQQGAQLDPNRNNRFGNPNNPVFGGQPMPGVGGRGGGGIASPDPGFLENLMQQLQQYFSTQTMPGNRIGQIKQGISRLKGNQQNQKPEMNKNPPRMPVPQSRNMMPGSIMPGSQMAPPSGGSFTFPQPRIGGGDVAMNPAMGGGMIGGGMNPGSSPWLQNPNNLAMIMGGQGNMRGFV
jgi:hypothetical protein